jgi:hypothetical protein
MGKPRRHAVVRVVPLESREAAEATVRGTMAERLALVARLSETSWSLTGLPLPTYTRAATPVVVTALDTRTRRPAE